MNLHKLSTWWQRLWSWRQARGAAVAPVQPRIWIMNEVLQSLEAGFAAHRRTARRDHETGWLLLGMHLGQDIVIAGTLPAGAACDASATHVRFLSLPQAVACRILRQTQRSLGVVGLVHTHPGDLREPSCGDLRGDREWVGKLRGRLGIFGIGTARAYIRGLPEATDQEILDFTWYSLAEGDETYRPARVEPMAGPDVGKAVHGLWPILEKHASSLERLCMVLSRVEFELGEGALRLQVPVAGIRVTLNEAEWELEQYDGQAWRTCPSPRASLSAGVFDLLSLEPEVPFSTIGASHGFSPPEH